MGCCGSAQKPQDDNNVRPKPTPSAAANGRTTTATPAPAPAASSEPAVAVPASNHVAASNTLSAEPPPPSDSKSPPADTEGGLNNTTPVALPKQVSPESTSSPQQLEAAASPEPRQPEERTPLPLTERSASEPGLRTRTKSGPIIQAARDRNSDYQFQRDQYLGDHASTLRYLSDPSLILNVSLSYKSPKEGSQPRAPPGSLAIAAHLQQLHREQSKSSLKSAPMGDSGLSAGKDAPSINVVSTSSNLSSTVTEKGLLDRSPVPQSLDELNSPPDAASGTASPEKKKEEEETLKRREEELRRQQEEEKRREEEAKRKEEERRKKEEEAKKKEEEAKRKEEERRKAEEEAKMKEEEKRKEEARKKEEEKRKREEEAKRKSTTHHKKDDKEEARHKAEAAKRKEEARKKEEEAKKKEEEAKKRKEEEEARKREEEARKREEEARKKEEEARRKEEEAKRKEEEARKAAEARRSSEARGVSSPPLVTSPPTLSAFGSNPPTHLEVESKSQSELPLVEKKASFNLFAPDTLSVDTVDPEPATPTDKKTRAPTPPNDYLTITTDYFARTAGGGNYGIKILCCEPEATKNKELDMMQGLWEDSALNAWTVKDRDATVVIKETEETQYYKLEDAKVPGRIALMDARVARHEWSQIVWTDGDVWQQVWEPGAAVDVYYGEDEGWFSGKIVKRAADGTYTVRFEDGEIAENVQGGHMRNKEKDLAETVHLLPPIDPRL